MWIVHDSLERLHVLPQGWEVEMDEQDEDDHSDGVALYVLSFTSFCPILLCFTPLSLRFSQVQLPRGRCQQAGAFCTKNDDFILKK